MMQNSDEAQAQLPSETRSGKKPVRLVKRSPLYQVCEELQQENGEWAASIAWRKIKKLSGREAFLIPLDGEPEDPLCSGFKERHFSIDRTYRHTSKFSRQHGYCPLHYTESYQMNGQRVIVHAYLDSNAQYVYSQIKIKKINSDEAAEALRCLSIPSTEEIKIAEEIKILREGKKYEGDKESKKRSEQVAITPDKLELDTKKNEEKIQRNVVKSLGVLSPLLKAREERYFKIKQETNVLQEELRILSLQLHLIGFHVYKFKAEELLAKIDVLNRYRESRDPRGIFISKALIGLEQQESKKEAEAVFTEDEETTVLDSVLSVDRESEEIGLATVREVKKAEEAKAAREQEAAALSGLQNLNKKLSFCPKDIKEVFELRQVYEETHQLLIRWLWSSKNVALRREQDKKLVEETLERIRQYEKIGVKLFEKASLEGDVKAAKELFLIFAHILEDGFYVSFVEQLIEKENPKKKELMEISSFFYLNAPNYRNIIFNLSVEGRYPFLKEAVLKLPDGFSEISFDIEISLLSKVYFNADIGLFELLLKQGANPNTWGLVPIGSHTPILTLFRQMVYFRDAIPECQSYLRLLLDYGVDTSKVMTRQQIKTYCKGAVQRNRMARRSREQMAALQHKGKRGGIPLRSVDTVHSFVHSYQIAPLLSCMRSKNFKLFSFLLPEVSFGEIAYALAWGSSEPYFRIKRILWDCFIFELLEDLENRDIIENIKKKGNTDGIFLSFLIHKDPLEFVPEKDELFYQMLKETYAVFLKKTKKMTIKEFELIYKKLFDLGQLGLQYTSEAFHGDALHVRNKHKPEEGKRSYRYFLACEFLLIAFAMNLDSEKEKAAFLISYYRDKGLLNSIVKTLKFQFSGQTLIGIKKFCQDWREQLQETYEIYQGEIEYPDQKTAQESMQQCSLSFAQSSKPKLYLASKLANFLFYQEFGITTADSNKPILGSTSIDESYAIIIFHRMRTCFIHWHDNVDHSQLDLVVNRFLGSIDAERVILKALTDLQIMGEPQRLIHEYLDSSLSVLSVEDCQVAIVGGQSKHVESCKSGNFIKNYFIQQGFKNINLEMFQPDRTKAKKAFCCVTVDARNGIIKIIDSKEISDKKLEQLLLKYIPNAELRYRRLRYADTVHLQDDRYPFSGTKLICIDDYESVCRAQLKTLLELCLKGKLKELKEFLDRELVVYINECLPNDLRFRSVLHFLCNSVLSRSQLACAELLVAHGANPFLQDKQGKTALELIQGNPEAAEKLGARRKAMEENFQAHEDQGSSREVLLAFALYKRNPMQLQPIARGGFQQIEEQLMTPQGRRLYYKR